MSSARPRRATSVCASTRALAEPFVLVEPLDGVAVGIELGTIERPIRLVSASSRSDLRLGDLAARLRMATAPTVVG